MFVLEVLWFLLPAAIANSVPSLTKDILPKYNIPVDLGLTFRGKRVFGAHKSLRGLILGTIAGGLIFCLQKYLVNESTFLSDISIIDYGASTIIPGLAISFGALLGDMIKSFFKRQINIQPGKPWFPFDQSDWLIGSIIFAHPFYELTPLIAISTLLIGVALHLLAKVIGFLTGIEKSFI